jgi:hypothetical protein
MYVLFCHILLILMVQNVGGDESSLASEEAKRIL